MNTLILAGSLIVLALAHSVLGERLLVGPLVAAHWPRLPLGRRFGKRVLRFAWHLTSLAWVGLAAVALRPEAAITIVGLAAVASGVVAFVASRGAHFAWAFFLAGGIAGLSGPSAAATAALLVSGILVCVAALHVAWALGLRWGLDVAVPDVHGAPALRPGRALTLLVAVLLAFGAVVALLATSGGLWRWLAVAGAFVCAARTVGDARLVGLFKRVRGSGFATWDDLLFTPLSFVMAVGFTLVAWGSR